MTIDEYLNQLHVLKAKERKAFAKMSKLYDKATSTHGAVFSEMPRKKSDGNRREDNLLSYIDAGNEWKKANALYHETRHNMERALENVLYWEGKLLYQVYIYNVIIESEDLYNGASDLLHTKSQHVINKKLAEAKAHLRELLISRGVEIE